MASGAPTPGDAGSGEPGRLRVVDAVTGEPLPQFVVAATALASPLVESDAWRLRLGSGSPGDSLFSAGDRRRTAVAARGAQRRRLPHRQRPGRRDRRGVAFVVDDTAAGATDHLGELRLRVPSRRGGSASVSTN